MRNRFPLAPGIIIALSLSLQWNDRSPWSWYHELRDEIFVVIGVYSCSMSRERVQRVYDHSSSNSDSETDGNSSSNDDQPSAINQLMSELGAVRGSDDSDDSITEDSVYCKAIMQAALFQKRVLGVKFMHTIVFLLCSADSDEEEEGAMLNGEQNSSEDEAAGNENFGEAFDEELSGEAEGSNSSGLLGFCFMFLSDSISHMVWNVYASLVKSSTPLCPNNARGRK